MFGRRFFDWDFKLFDVEGGGGGGAVVADAGGGGADSVVGAPNGTADIIRASIAGAGGAEGEGGELEGKGESKPELSPEEQAEEAELGKLEAELKAKNTKLIGKMDVARHQAVLTRQRNQAEAAAKKLQEEHAAKMKELEWAADPEARAAIEAISIMDRDPSAFIKVLMTDPRYQSMIQLKEAQEAAREAQRSGGDQVPEPDASYKDENGQEYRYYSAEGLNKRMEYERQKAVNEAKEALLKEIGPVMEEHKARNAWNKAVGDNKKIVSQAEANWPGFKENKAAIGKAMLENESLSLEDAYREVVVKQLYNKPPANEAELRKKILEELKAKPGAASGEKPGSGPERKADGEKSGGTADIIRASLRKEGLL